MKLFTTVLVLALAACGSSKKSNSATTTTVASTGETEEVVDPTLPSWAPKSCNAYHTVVVKAVDCAELDQGMRDSIKAKYETQRTAWASLQNAEQAQIDQIGTECTEDTKAVQAQADGKCVTAASM
ncbi:MAG: hypothetical protein H0T46_17895 [Deltaproteobacteria bacterium]|nr:hypothetical protein [Deltaproteobacteria bacterium]